MPRFWATISKSREVRTLKSKPTPQSKPTRGSLTSLRRVRLRGGKRTCHRFSLRNCRRRMPKGWLRRPYALPPLRNILYAQSSNPSGYQKDCLPCVLPLRLFRLGTKPRQFSVVMNGGAELCQDCVDTWLMREERKFGAPGDGKLFAPEDDYKLFQNEVHAP
jgi:hypothetical protein